MSESKEAKPAAPKAAESSKTGSDSPKSFNLGVAFGSAAIPILIAWILLIIIIVLRLKKKKIYDKIADKTYGIEQQV